MRTIDQLVRANVKKMKTYTAARDEVNIENATYLDANENAYELVGNGLNRYPDPYQSKLKQKLSKVKNVNSNQIFIGNGSDEAIDLIIRSFCEPRIDSIIVMPPTFGMYQVSAELNDVGVEKLPLTSTFDIDMNAFNSLEKKVEQKILFICNPNNPTGNLMNRNSILAILNSFDGIVVIDEAYIDFTNESSFIKELENYPNLIVIQTFSKAWGMAGARIGMAYASDEIIDLLNKIKPPYNINSLTQEAVLSVLEKSEEKENYITLLASEKLRMSELLKNYFDVVYPSDSNFLLVKSDKTTSLYTNVLNKGIVTRQRLSLPYAGDCLRITIGTPEENNALINALEEVKS